MERLTLLLFILLSWLQYSLWFGKNNIYNLVCIVNDIKAQQSNNIKLKERNDQIFLEINTLKDRKEAIEEYSRQELGMIKPGETFYQLISRPSK